MTALMQEVVERVHAIPKYRQDEVLSRLLDVISEEEDNAPDEHIAYVEIADDLTDEERAGMAATRKEFKEHPENFISLDELLAKNGMRRENYRPAKIVYNI
jgi:hypothetical protein